jgi:hypothetical protein
MAVRHLLAAPAPLVVLLATFPGIAPAQRTPGTTPYPVVRADTTSGVYHGTRVEDPYRWLEGCDNPEIATFLVSQRDLTSRLIERIPQRDAIRRRLVELRDVPRTATGAREGGRLFALRRLAGKPVAALAMRETLPPPSPGALATLTPPEKAPCRGYATMASACITFLE